MMKKTWTAPVVEELGISATLSGKNLANYETQYLLPSGDSFQYGTIPNPITK